MRGSKYLLVSILLVIVLIAAGCSAANIPQTGANTSAQPAATSASAVSSVASSAVSPVASSAKAGSPGSASSGGLVISIDVQNSEARYRVREQLANVSLPSDAVGKTKAISGSVTIKPDGTIDTNSSKFVVDLSTLQSDRSMRDNYVRRAILQTDQYPTATFVPTKVSGLAWPLPQSGPVTFQLTGDLTIHNVTKPVTWNVTGTIQNGKTGQASGTATTTFTFEDFQLNQPRVPVVLSVQDHITLELDLALQSAAQ